MVERVSTQPHPQLKIPEMLADVSDDADAFYLVEAGCSYCSAWTDRDSFDVHSSAEFLKESVEYDSAAGHRAILGHKRNPEFLSFPIVCHT